MTCCNRPLDDLGGARKARLEFREGMRWVYIAMRNAAGLRQEVISPAFKTEAEAEVWYAPIREAWMAEARQRRVKKARRRSAEKAERDATPEVA
jgi:hypothetical protein